MGSNYRYTCSSCGEESIEIPCAICHLGMFREEAVQLVDPYRTTSTKGVHPWCVQYALERGFKKQSSSCFIATAVYETPSAPEVAIFRTFRDERLTQHWAGRLFIETYYATSPPIARLLAKSRTLREMTKRLILNPILHVIEK